MYDWGEKYIVTLFLGRLLGYVAVDDEGYNTPSPTVSRGT